MKTPMQSPRSAWTLGLGDVHVTVRNAGGEQMFDRSVDAPWLLLNLPPGRCEIAAEHADQTKRMAVNIRPRQRREVVVYFLVKGMELSKTDSP